MADDITKYPTHDGGASPDAAARTTNPSLLPTREVSMDSRSELGSGRSERPLLGQQVQKLSVPQEPGFRYRWFNDLGNRIDMAQAAGYEFVQDTKEIDESGRGQRLRKVVGTQANGQPQHAYCMRKPEDLYQADEARKKGPIQEMEKAIHRGMISGGDPQDNGVYYAPQGGINIQSGVGGRRQQ
jgi:hypothetical protein